MNIQLKNEFLTVTVNSMGAELRSVRGADGTEYLWRGDAALWGIMHRCCFRSAAG